MSGGVTTPHHPKPAWQHKANYVIGAKVIDPAWLEYYSLEQLAVHKLANRRYEICCIPFVIYDLCLGDIVSLDEEFNVDLLLRRSEHRGFRVTTAHKEQQENVLTLVQAKGCLTEVHGDTLCAIDTENETTTRYIADLLASLERQGFIMRYETMAS